MRFEARLFLIPVIGVIVGLACSSGGSKNPVDEGTGNNTVSITISPAHPDVAVGDTVTFTATVKDADGNVLDVPVGWRVESDIGNIDPTTGAFESEFAGYVTIAVSSENGGEQTLSFQVHGGGLYLDINAGTLTDRPDSTNEAVTSSNAKDVNDLITTDLLSVLAGLVDSLVTANTAEPASGYIDSQLEYGRYSGSATITGVYNFATDPLELYFDFTVVLSDYSDSGPIFTAGTATYSVISEYNTGTLQYDIQGAIRFNGSWEGQERLALKTDNNAPAYNYTISAEVESGGTSFNYAYPSQ